MGNSALGLAIALNDFAFIGKNSHLVGVDLETGILITQRVHNNKIQLFTLEFTLSIAFFIVGFQCKSHSHLVGTFGLPNSAGDIRIWGEMQHGGGIFLTLDFLFGDVVNTVIGYCGTQDDCIALGQCVHHSVMHLLCGGYIDTMDIAVFGLESNGTGNKGHMGTSASALLGEGKAHFARRKVADVTHRVDFLHCRSGSYQHVLALKVLSGCEVGFQCLDDVLGFLHAALADKVAGKLALGRLDNVIAVTAQ